METITEKPLLPPIVNGRFNWSIQPSEFEKYSFEQKRDMAWNLIIGADYAHAYHNIDPEIFVPRNMKYTHGMIKEDTVDFILNTVYVEAMQHHKELMQSTYNHWFKQGGEIFKAQKKLKFGGFLEMEYGKVVGYLYAAGSRNNLNHQKVANAVNNLESLAPKKQYGESNPNNGQRMHVWSVRGDYVTMKFDYLTTKDEERVMEFYKQHWEPIGRTIKADSIRFERQEHNVSSSCSVEFVYWWD